MQYKEAEFLRVEAELNNAIETRKSGLLRRCNNIGDERRVQVKIDVSKRGFREGYWCF